VAASRLLGAARGEGAERPARLVAVTAPLVFPEQQVRRAGVGGRRPAAYLARRVEAGGGVEREEGVERRAGRHHAVDTAHEAAEGPRFREGRMEERVEGRRPGDREDGEDVHESPPAPAARRAAGDDRRDRARDREQHQHGSRAPRGRRQRVEAERIRGAERVADHGGRGDAGRQRRRERREQQKGRHVEARADARDAEAASLGGRVRDPGREQHRDRRIERKEIDAPFGRREGEEDEPGPDPRLGEARRRPPRSRQRRHAEGQERRPWKEAYQSER